ncbi:hypothetical protein BH10ACI1_BH10ACI1_23100 [soil metagenome]
MSDKFIGQTLAEKYRIEELRRESGLGNIYRGKHLLMEKDVTIKILAPALAVDENIVRRFSDEARTVSHISHPNILNVTDFGTDADGAVYIVSEESEGETLRQAIAREGKFTPERAVRVARQIASALSAAHAAGVVHRNLMSENILLAHTVNNAEIVKILEFGAGNSTDENESFDEENMPQNLEYRSPEQCSDSAQVDARSDIYSAGVILYEMLAGEVPFAAEKPTDLMLKHAQEPPAPLVAFRSDLPEEIEPVVLRALAKTPEMRYQTADEFADELNKLAKNFDEVETVIIPQSQINPDKSSNNIWKTAFLVLAGISVLAIGLIYATQVKQTNPTTQLTDANGQPVQPLNPATGMGEQGNLMQAQYSPQELANMNLNTNTAANGMLPGDYNPMWNQGYVPQQGNYVQPSGNYYDTNQIDTNSTFTRDNDIIVNQNVNTQQNTATNTTKATPIPTKTPTPVPTKETTPTPTKTPIPKPTDKPNTNKPTSEKQVTSDKKQDTN